jgi:hypothetical protein
LHGINDLGRKLKQPQQVSRANAEPLGQRFDARVGGAPGRLAGSRCRSCARR